MIANALVVGASGYVGGRILSQLGARGLGTYSSRPAPGLVAFDAARDRLEDLLQGRNVSHVFVPYGAIDPERCARDPAGTMEINVVSVVRLIDAAFRAGVTPVYFSTDYVFDGVQGSFRETDPLEPNTSYGAQKAAVEHWMASVPKPQLVVRLSKVVGPETGVHSVIGQWIGDIKAGKPQRCATDQVFCPAWNDDIARAVIALADAGQTGTWHVAGAVAISRYDFLQILMEEIRKVDPSVTIPIEACSLHDIPFLEKRPLNTSMNTDKLHAWLDWSFKPLRQLCAEAARQHFG